MKIKKNYLKNRNILSILVILSLIILSGPHILRISGGNNNLIGGESYRLLKISEDILNHDEVQYGKANFTFNLFYYVLAFFSVLVNIFWVARLLPIFLGTFSIIFFYAILLKFKAKKETAFITCLLLIFSPLFIYVFSTLTGYSLIIFLALLGCVLFLVKKEYLGTIFLGSIILIDFISFLIITFLIFLYCAKKRNYSFLLKFMAFAVFIFIIGIIFFRYLPNLNFGIAAFSFSNVFAEFGALIGISLALFIFYLINIFHSWKSSSLFYNIIFLLISALAFFNPKIIVYFGFIVVYFAGKEIFRLMDRKWFFNIKKITLLLIVFTLLFSSFSMIVQLKDAQPTPTLVKALKNIPSSAVVFSHYEYSPYLQYFSNSKVLLNESFNKKTPPELRADIETILYSRELNKTEDLLNEYGIGIIFISTEMKQGLFWSREEEGLLFLLPNSERFIKIYKLERGTEEYEIWSYKK